MTRFLGPLSLVYGLLLLIACQPQRSAPSAEPALNAQLPAGGNTTTAASARPDSSQPATDGDSVAMPVVRQRVLLQKDSLWARALRIHYNALVMDGHLDTPTLMLDEGYQFAERHRSLEADVDLPRMTQGGLDAAFFSIYVASRYGEGARATRRARAMIAELKQQVTAADSSAAMAYSADDVRRLTQAGKTAVLMGLEGGHALAGSPDSLRALYDAGIRYVTLTHDNTNLWADASQDVPRHGGLNARGRNMVRTMNRLGVLVDLSHVSDSTFYDALEVTEAPPILSHSSARALVNNVRNVSDDMLRALAEKDGVIMINFFDPMVNQHLTDEVMDAVYRRLGPSKKNLRQIWFAIYDVRRERGLGGATLDDVLDHIDHAVQVAGLDHVGLGSDFDGVKNLPDGLHDVTRLPWITHGLLKRGYTEEEIYKILGGNTLRVLEAAERVAARQ